MIGSLILLGGITFFVVLITIYDLWTRRPVDSIPSRAKGSGLKARSARVQRDL